MTTSAVFDLLGEIMAIIWGVFGDVASTIMTNKLLFVPVLIGCAATLMFFAISAVRKFGIRGVASSGRRR